MGELPATLTEEQLARLDTLTREAIDERLRVLEGVSGAVYRCVEELTRVRSVLPPRSRGDAGAGARREQPTAASSEPSSTSSAGTAGREEAPSVANGNGKAVDVGVASSEEERSSSETESDEFEVEGGFVVR